MPDVDANRGPLDVVKRVPEKRDAQENAERAAPAEAHRPTPLTRDQEDRTTQPWYRRSPSRHGVVFPHVARLPAQLPRGRGTAAHRWVRGAAPEDRRGRSSAAPRVS